MILNGRGFFSAIGDCPGALAPREKLRLFQEVAYLGKQFSLPRGLGRLGRLGGLLALQGGNALDHREQYEGNDEEIDHDRDETSPSQYGTLFFCFRQRVR